MADYALGDGYGVDTPEASGSLTTFINWAGAAVSLALIGGLAAWGWQLLQRDVSGVPVITALEGPMRIAPEDPGGIIAEHQGLAVNHIPALGEAAPGADQVVLAPQPVALTEEDAPMSALLPDEGPTEAEDSAVAAALQELSPMDLAVVSALAELEDEGVLEAEPEPEFEASARAVGASPRPLPRPDLTLAAAERVTPVSTAAGGRDADPAAIAPGTRLVQLGAFPTLQEAEAEWARLDAGFSDYMVGKQRLIQEAEAGQSTFYRLRAVGFDGLDDARRFCAVLIAGNGSCIPVVAR